MDSGSTALSGLCFISRLVEQVVASQLNNHVICNKLENVSQAAYNHYSSVTELKLQCGRLRMKTVLHWLNMKPLLFCFLTNQQCLI